MSIANKMLNSLSLRLPSPPSLAGIYLLTIIFADTDFFQQSVSVSAADYRGRLIGQAIFINFSLLLRCPTICTGRFVHKQRGEMEV